MTFTKSFSRKSSRSEPGHRRVNKVQISAPVELLSTTNMITYTSPNLRFSTSSTSSLASGIGSAYSPTSPTSGSFSPVSASSSVSEMETSSPPTSPRVQPNHLSSYFAPPHTPLPLPERSKSLTSTKSSNSGAGLPRRTPSSPSISSKPSYNGYRKSGSNRGSTSSSRHASTNPFGAELAKVSELAEDYGVSVDDAELEFMSSHGLRRFDANDYLREIGLFGGMYDDEQQLDLGAGWI